jgi:Pyridoxamine 5'-phosphate oxidase
MGAVRTLTGVIGERLLRTGGQTMAIAVHPEKPAAAPAAVDVSKHHTTSDEVWHQLEKTSFAVVSYVTPAGEPRSSGVVYKAVARRLYIAVAPDSWKARYVSTGNHVSVTIPVPRGGILALAMPIPPATISFHATAMVHTPESVETESLVKQLGSLLPPERRHAAVIIELVPEGNFLTYGIGVSLMDMQKPEIARAVFPVAG